MKITVFDTETTGLIPKNIDISNLILDDLQKCPYILQFSYINYDTETNEIIKYSDDYVKNENNIEIPIESTKIHGITSNKIDKNGKNIEEVIDDFMCIYTSSTDKLVGHNISYDVNMLLIELMRLVIKNENNKWIVYYNIIFKNMKNVYCTMKNTVNICNISSLNKNGQSYMKYPKLNELYFHLFNETPNNLHDSLIDCFCCLRCYVKIIYEYDVVRKNKTAKRLFTLLT